MAKPNLSTTRPSARIRVWTRPRLQPAPQDGSQGGADSLWTAGEVAEAAYEFETAHDAYLAAAHAAANARALDYVTRYAAFLVERFGQFDEVARWLDDPGFDPVAGGLTLGRLLARAADEVGHPRALALDTELAAIGEPTSLDRAAQRLVQAGKTAAARTLLERHAAHLTPLGMGEKLLRQMRDDDQARCTAALQPAETALAAQDLTAAQAALDGQRPTWGHAGPFLSLEARLREAEAKVAVQAQRQRVTAALARGDVDEAHALAKALVGAPGASETDRQTLATLQAQTREAAARVQAAQVRAEAEAARQAERARAQRLEAEQLALRAAEAALAETVQACLDAGDLDGATAALAAWQASAGAKAAASPTVKQLRGDLQAARQQEERNNRLRSELESALQDGHFFTARARLGELAHVLSETERFSLRARIEETAAPALRAKAVPPFGLKLAAAPLACGVAQGRLLLVQDRLWLTVNLETLGLQPFQLPESWPISGAALGGMAQALTRIGSVLDRTRLVGLSQGRLVVVEQAPGQAPAVVAGASLGELLCGDDQLLGAAIEPEAATWGFLSGSAHRPGATNWTRVDAATLEVLEHRRTQPALAGVCGIQGLPGAALAAAALKAKQGQGLRTEPGALAAARLDDRGEAQAQWTLEDLGEAVASFRQAMAWPGQDRVYASYTFHDPFGLGAGPFGLGGIGTTEPGTVHAEPSLLVLRGDRVTFASSDLRRRFVPADRLTIDHPWTLDPTAGRLWFAALPTEGPQPRDAQLLGVDARTLRPDKPVPMAGVERVLALLPLEDGAVAVCRLQGGGHGLCRAKLEPDGLRLTTSKLPL